jgi:hypothetical protein
VSRLFVSDKVELGLLLLERLRRGLPAFVVAGVDAFLMAAAQQLVEFVHEQVEGFVGVLAAGAGEQVGTANLQAAFGDEMFLLGAGAVELELDATSDDAVFMAEKAVGLFDCGGAQGGGEVEVHAAYDDTVGAGISYRGVWHSATFDAVAAETLLTISPGDSIGGCAAARFPSWKFPRRRRRVVGMKCISLLLAFIALPWAAAATAAASDPLEQEVVALVAAPTVTVVHFWAPWCDNSQAELTPEGWAKFIAANPAVKFIFLNVWHKGQNPEPVLKKAGLGAQPNLLLRTHPNPSRLEADRLNVFLGQRLAWLPTTWVYRAGQQRFAFNYGEIRFSVLQQMVEDTRNTWTHE